MLADELSRGPLDGVGRRRLGSAERSACGWLGKGGSHFAFAAERRSVGAQLCNTAMAMRRTDDEQVAAEGSRNAAELIAQDNAAPLPSTARANLSSIMPGWFSEVSPMWPGLSR